ncbi:MAG TPA: hypothetical protein DCY48_04430 [Candidatus Magasanikbacteria bacterium]|nr:MAG: hypothetical protein A3I74_01515 [Candidatus Magasanikbacteria bacterium RIFCSPLOWO2_02_FULL_47_16]OGH79838.1 MAG: hypothetical protein A3C10_00020 [Candidatus Magasanikbacteria bacterium RIFCSPHIGHO2_02_FULL_48_18]OGH82432.1 MAG: hypothetical protein A3G08_02620 [Candidatus Magasanikbacteria bacterium RIFCSPLOWO2_12_FULL_47_9b]HAZ28989.1 hypothetical protein [Candidatus Magasanikbacteria bacterium]
MPQTVKQLLKQAKKHNHTDALDAEYLLAHVLRATREAVLAHPERRVSAFQTWQYRRMIQKRATGIPVHYLVKKAEFYGLSFFVNAHVLIPRPSTETLAEAATALISEYAAHPDHMLFMDIGTGSGAIPIAVLRSLPPKISHPATIATDISRNALAVAKKNAKMHGLAITFLHGHLLRPVMRDWHKTYGHIRHIILTANLPYLTKEEIKESNTIRHEPLISLWGPENGLGWYRALLEQMTDVWSMPIESFTAFFEMNPHQMAEASAMVLAHFPSAHIAIEKDLGGLDRMLRVEIAKP